MWILTCVKFLCQTFGQTLDFPLAIIETISLQTILQNMPSNYLMRSFWKIGQTNHLYHLLILDDMVTNLVNFRAYKFVLILANEWFDYFAQWQPKNSRWKDNAYYQMVLEGYQLWNSGQAIIEDEGF